MFTCKISIIEDNQNQRKSHMWRPIQKCHRIHL